MLSKLAFNSLALSTFVSADSFVLSSDRSPRQTLDRLRNGQSSRPVVRAGDCANAASAVDRLKKGPANVPRWEFIGEYNDEDFVLPENLWYDGYEDYQDELNWTNDINDGTYQWKRYKDVEAYKNNKMFVDDTVSYNEVNQGGAGTCYFMAALGSAGEWPEMITNMFLQTESEIGLYLITFYIRGKPWMVSVDDRLLFENDVLFHAQPADNGAMWAPILEKAWAKMKGNYAQVNGGFVVNGLRMLTGAPTFTYDLATFGLTAAETFSLLTAANDVDYPMGASTGTGLTYADCGIANAHAYSVLGTFEMDNADMVMLRNPWGTTTYSGTWNKDDSSWTDAKVAQVPFGVDPRTSDTDGIFVMPIAEFIDTSSQCLKSFEISHDRSAEGYSDAIYDKEDDDGSLVYYYVTVPADDGDLYFTTESYYQDLVPNECTTGTYLGNQVTSPVIDIELYKDAQTITTAYKLYSDQFAYPLLITSYDAGVVWKISVQYTWFGSSAPDYTLKVYSKQDLSLLDASGNSIVLNYDSTLPTAFTGEEPYLGMDAWFPTEDMLDDGFNSLGDVFRVAFEGNIFMAWFKLGFICLFAAPGICFLPWKWFNRDDSDSE